MSNNHIHPIMQDVLAPFAPKFNDYPAPKLVLPAAHRVFSVSINLGGELIELDVLARSSIAAITQAIELAIADDECPADGLTITCKLAVK